MHGIINTEAMRLSFFAEINTESTSVLREENVAPGVQV